MNLKLTKIDFVSSIICALLSPVDILPVICTLLNFALYVIKTFKVGLCFASNLFDYELYFQICCGVRFALM